MVCHITYIPPYHVFDYHLVKKKHSYEQSSFLIGKSAIHGHIP